MQLVVDDGGATRNVRNAGIPDWEYLAASSALPPLTPLALATPVGSIRNVKTMIRGHRTVVEHGFVRLLDEAGMALAG